MPAAIWLRQQQVRFAQTCHQEYQCRDREGLLQRTVEWRNLERGIAECRSQDVQGLYHTGHRVGPFSNSGAGVPSRLSHLRGNRVADGQTRLPALPRWPRSTHPPRRFMTRCQYSAVANALWTRIRMSRRSRPFVGLAVSIQQLGLAGACQTRAEGDRLADPDDILGLLRG